MLSHNNSAALIEPKLVIRCFIPFPVVYLQFFFTTYQIRNIFQTYHISVTRQNSVTLRKKTCAFQIKGIKRLQILKILVLSVCTSSSYKLCSKQQIQQRCQLQVYILTKNGLFHMNFSMIDTTDFRKATPRTVYPEIVLFQQQYL